MLAVWLQPDWTMPEVVKKLFDDIGPRFANRKGGYTRVLHSWVPAWAMRLIWSCWSWLKNNPSGIYRIGMARYQVILAYDGTDFQGFQRQGSNEPFRGKWRGALATWAGDGRFSAGAGRTDTGVHASGR